MRWLADARSDPKKLLRKAVRIAELYGMAIGEVSRLRSDDRYLDTAAASFRSLGRALRLRRTDHERTLQVKRAERRSVDDERTPSPHVDHETVLAWARPMPRQIDQLPREIRNGLGPTAAESADLEVVLRLQQIRYQVILSPSGKPRGQPRALLSIDDVLAPIEELRIELEVDEWSEAWSNFARSLESSLGLTTAKRDKFATALATALSTTAPAPTDVSGPGHPPRRRNEPTRVASGAASAADSSAEGGDRTPAEAGAAESAEGPGEPRFVADWLGRPFERHLEFGRRLLDEPTAKRVRRFRVTCRHLRTRLTILEHYGVLPKGRRPIRDLRRRARRAGELRDLDVLIDRLHRLDDGEERILAPAYSRVRDRLLQARHEKAQCLQRTLASKRSRKAESRIRSLVDELAGAPLQGTLGDLVAVSVPHAVSNLRRAIEQALQTGETEHAHAARLAVKRLRYLCRSFRFGFALQPVEALLVPAQDALGELQDTEVSCETALALALRRDALDREDSVDRILRKIGKKRRSAVVLGAFMQRESDRREAALASSFQALRTLQNLDWSAFDPQRWKAEIDLGTPLQRLVIPC